ncbi:hypothetical protein Tco_0849237 [Tanacetum coccineum]
MAAESIIPQLVDKKGGSYFTIAPRLELEKINKWKKRMLCYLTGMKPYYLKCIKEGPYQPKIVECEIKPEFHWTNNERRVVNQDHRLKSIIMSCLPDDIIESVISCETAEATWTDLVHSFKGPSDTKENKIVDLKLEYQTFRAKPSESLSQTYTRYKTLFNQLPNDDVTLSKHEMNDSQEKSDDEADERTSEEYLKDLELEFHERALLENLKQPSYKSPVSNVSSVSKGFQPKFTPKLIQSSQPAQSSQNEPKIQKDYKAEYKKMKAKLALLEAKVLDDEEMTQVKVLMALVDDELSVEKNHSRNGEWIDITIRKNKIIGGELLTGPSSKNKVKENPFVPASLDYDHEMVPKSKDWVERHNPNSKLLNFNTGRILVPESQAINKCLKLTKAPTDPKSSKESGSEPLTPLPPLKNL